MRVIAGKFRSRPLRSLRGMDIRPTADRLRETLFNVLTAGNPEALAGARWLDLFAGTGAVGIEALSRGAAYVCFVESARQAARAIYQNLQSLGVKEGFEIQQLDVNRALPALVRQSSCFEYCFLDPPYRLERAYAEALIALGSSTLLAPNATVIAEHDKRFDPGDGFSPLERYRTLVEGDAALSFYRRPNG